MDTIDAKVIYEQIGLNYRYFLVLRPRNMFTKSLYLLKD